MDASSRARVRTGLSGAGSALDGRRWPQTLIGPLIVTAVGTGARQGELLALRWQDIDSDSMVIRHTLTRTGELAEPKTERSRRTIALSATVQAALRRQKLLQRGQAARDEWQDLGFVFTRDDGRPMSADMARNRYHAVVTAAGLPPLPFHHLRHAFATLHIEAGEDLASVSRMLGRNSIRVTADTYGHLTPATQRRAADRMDAILTG